MDDDDDRKVITVRTRGGRNASRSHNNSDTNEYQGWTKNEPSKQDKINQMSSKITEALENFERILPENYDKVEPGTFIRYIKYDEKSGKPQIRLGGYLIKNKAPTYWVLKTKTKPRPITWSVQLKNLKGTRPNEYFQKKGLLPRDEKTRYALEVFDGLDSGQYKLIKTNMLETLVGEKLSKPKKQTQQQIYKVDKNGGGGGGGGGESSEEEVRIPQLKAQFLDIDSDEESW